MAKAFYSNFDFEHQLAGVPRKNAATIAANLSATWLAIADANDCIARMPSVDQNTASQLKSLGRAVPDGRLADAETLVPWGWDQSALDFADQHGLQAKAPALDSVREVNSRRFSFELETEFGCGLEGAAHVRSIDDFLAKTSVLPKWLAKSEFSMSSRERIPGSGSPTEQQVNWAQNRFDEGSSIFVEPWLDLADEYGVQFEISPSGSVEVAGITGLLTTDRGGFVGCLIGAAPIETSAVETTHRAAVRVAERGYFGPLGIDVARYELNGQMHVRPIQDINARHTMGRLALGWRNLLAEGEVAAWLFLPASNSETAVENTDRVRLVRTSPLGATGLTSFLLIAGSISHLQSHATRLLSAQNRTLRWPKPKSL